jgi:hypothetical protein
MVYQGLVTATFVQWPNWSVNYIYILCPIKTLLRNQFKIMFLMFLSIVICAIVNNCKSNIVILDRCSWSAIHFFLTMAYPKKWHQESAGIA